MSGAVHDLVREALRSAGDHTPWEQVEIVTHGSSSLVALTAETAVRVSRHRGNAAELLRTQRLVDAMPELPFRVPVSAGDAVLHDGAVAVPTVRLGGTAHPPGHGDPGVLRGLLEEIHALDIGAENPDLAERKAFTGGGRWREVLQEEVLPLLPARVESEARRRIEALCALPEVGTCFSHGDLAGENVRWDRGEIVAVLDWDLATYEDPAEDVASLAWWHGWDVLPRLTDEATAARAAVYRDAFPLQMIAFQIVRGGDAAALEATIARVLPALSG